MGVPDIHFECRASGGSIVVVGSCRRSILGPFAFDQSILMLKLVPVIPQGRVVRVMGRVGNPIFHKLPLRKRNRLGKARTLDVSGHRRSPHGPTGRLGIARGRRPSFSTLLLPRLQHSSDLLDPLEQFVVGFVPGSPIQNDDIGLQERIQEKLAGAPQPQEIVAIKGHTGGLVRTHPEFKAVDVLGKGRFFLERRDAQRVDQGGKVFQRQRIARQGNRLVSR